MVQIVSSSLSLLTLVGGILAVLLLLLILFVPKQSGLFKFFGRYSIWFALLIATIAMSGSLFYSEVAGYEPCKLCWFQRIFFYPQVILLAIAIWRKDKTIIDYSLVLSVIGGIIAAYHYLLQVGVVTGTSCAVVGYSAACSQRFVLQYGYITIPMMALTGFALVVLLMIIRKLYIRSFNSFNGN